MKKERKDVLSKDVKVLVSLSNNERRANLERMSEYKNEMYCIQ